ncbi:MAG: hypothetical protein VXW51_06355 [Pseudomonadota bacterium]|nr:hypothetical protein [Pseudomonadota bacterium]
MKKFKGLLIIFFIYGCGFKVIDPSNFQNFYINNIETTGDKRLGYQIKNKLSIKSKDSSKENINLYINVEKEKTVKEKSSSNEITKYLITVNLKVEVEHFDKIIKVYNISEQKDYNVSSQYSQTIVNENQVIKSLNEILISKLIKKISLINFNDL